MSTSLPISKTGGRLHHPDGSFADYLVFRFPPGDLHFRSINQSDLRIKLRDIAHLRYFQARERGERDPLIVTFALPEQDRPVEQVFPGVSTTGPGGEHVLSANSFITATMRRLVGEGRLHYRDGEWHGVGAGRRVIGYLASQNRLHLELGPGRRPPACLDFSDLSVLENLVAVGRCGFLSEAVGRVRPRLAFNASFFLLEHDDFFSHHSALGEAYNLWVADGIVRRPPLYRRGGIFLREGHWQVGYIGLDDLELILPTGLRLLPHDVQLPGGAIPFTLNEQEPSEVTLYTRYFGVAGQGRVPGYTPAVPDRWELTVVDRRVVSWQVGGNLALPQNGFVVSFAPGVLSTTEQRELQDALRAQPVLDYRMARPQHQGIEQALQVGPILLRDGRSPLTNTYLEEREQFWASRLLADGTWQIGVSPTDYKTNVDQRRHGRVGLGIDRADNLILVMIACVKPEVRIPGEESAGATLAELTTLLQDAGAVDAVNLDGGGSTQVHYLGGEAIGSGDRRGLPQVRYERMIPSAGMVL
jgi:hypothetical protein